MVSSRPNFCDLNVGIRLPKRAIKRMIEAEVSIQKRLFDVGMCRRLVRWLKKLRRES